MQRFFTLFTILVIVNIGYSQKNNTFTITAPEAIKGNYSLGRFTWGPQPSGVITGDAIVGLDIKAPANDGCDSIATDLKGKIAFIDRATCVISDKSINAEKKGAIAVIICNTATGSQASAVAAGTGADKLKIPTYMLSFNDCQKIRTQLNNGEVKGSINFVNCTPTITYPSNVIWGNKPKQGDFSGGLNDWIFDKENTWNYAQEGEMIRGSFGGATMTSPTACNGIAEFNTDYLDNADLCTAPCTGALISPVIDIPAGTKGLAIEFSQGIRHFAGDYYLILSKNQGSTWPDTIRLNSGLYVNDAATTNLRERVALPVSYASVSKLRFKFEAVSFNYYFWGIDDVLVLDQAPYADLQVMQNFYAVAPSYKTPVTQAQEMPLLADIGNKGNINAENAVLTATLKSGNTILQTENNNYPLIKAYEVFENKLFPKTMTQPSTAGVYNLEYNIKVAGDLDSTNNKQDLNFIMTPNTFGKIPSDADNGSNYLGFVYNNLTFWRDEKFYSIGNSYYVKNNKSSSGANLVIGKVRFGIANTIASVNNSVIKVDVLEFNDKNADGDVQAGETKKVGTNVVFLTSDITNARRIEVDIFQPDTDGSVTDKKVPLKAETLYLVMLHTEPAAASTPQIQLLGYDPRTLNTTGRDFYYGATNLAYDVAGLLRSASSFGGKGTAITDNDTREIFRVDFKTAFIEMDIASASSSYEIATDAEAKIYPNPASTELFIDLALPQVSKNVKVDLVAIDGKIASSTSFQQVQNASLRVDVNSVVSGTYNALIHTDAGVITRKVIIQKQ